MRREQVLERLALLDPQELIEEAKVEVCRATRDLRSCGRPVHHVLAGCGHACLCAECRTPVSNKSVPDQLRLYELCVEAGLVVQHDDDDDDDEHHHHHPADVQTVSPPDDVRRLRAFFDVALDNNLVALVCHCILKNSCSLLQKPETSLLDSPSPACFLFPLDFVYWSLVELGRAWFLLSFSLLLPRLQKTTMVVVVSNNYCRYVLLRKL
jgi:hypothetical protein